MFAEKQKLVADLEAYGPDGEEHHAEPEAEAAAAPAAEAPAAEAAPAAEEAPAS